MQLSYKTPIWLYPDPVDFRKQIDGLVLLVADSLSLKPTSGELFVFRNRSAKKSSCYGMTRMDFGYVISAWSAAGLFSPVVTVLWS